MPSGAAAVSHRARSLVLFRIAEVVDINGNPCTGDTLHSSDQQPKGISKRGLKRSSQRRSNCHVMGKDKRIQVG